MLSVVMRGFIHGIWSTLGFAYPYYPVIIEQTPCVICLCGEGGRVRGAPTEAVPCEMS